MNTLEELETKRARLIDETERNLKRARLYIILAAIFTAINLLLLFTT